MRCRTIQRTKRLPFAQRGSDRRASEPPAVATAGYRVAVFLEGGPQQAGTNPQTPIGYASPGWQSRCLCFDFGVDAIPGATALTLTSGSHFISAAVEMIDPSIDAAPAGLPNNTGFGPRSESFEIVLNQFSIDLLWRSSIAAGGLRRQRFG
ncbi:MAG: hypothetical protein R3C05_28750 [Pirellulaceae bacterium]